MCACTRMWVIVTFILSLTSEFRDPCAFPVEGSGIDDGAVSNLSKGDPNTADLLAPVSVLAPEELLALPVLVLPKAQGLEFQIRAPGQQMVMVCRTEVSARTSAWC